MHAWPQNQLTVLVIGQISTYHTNERIAAFLFLSLLFVFLCVLCCKNKYQGLVAKALVHHPTSVVTVHAYVPLSIAR